MLEKYSKTRDKTYEKMSFYVPYKFKFPLIYDLPKNYKKKTFVCNDRKEFMQWCISWGLLFNDEIKLTKEEISSFENNFKTDKKNSMMKKAVRIKMIKTYLDYMESKPIEELEEELQFIVEFALKANIAKVRN